MSATAEILVIDNYDSFTWNLVHYLMELGAKVEVVRNDAISAGQAVSSGAKGFLISPGPARQTKPGSVSIWSEPAPMPDCRYWVFALATSRSASISAGKSSAAA